MYECQWICFMESHKVSTLVAAVILVLRRRRRKNRRSQDDEDAGNYDVYKPPVAKHTPYTQVASCTEHF